MERSAVELTDEITPILPEIGWNFHLQSEGGSSSSGGSPDAGEKERSRRRRRRTNGQRRRIVDGSTYCHRRGGARWYSRKIAESSNVFCMNQSPLEIVLPASKEQCRCTRRSAKSAKRALGS